MTETAPTTDYERFLAALPADLREACGNRLRGSGLAANHPVFLALAELYEAQNVKPPRDFAQEAAAHAELGKKLLSDFQALPEAILCRIEPQLVGLLGALNEPVEKLDVAATSLQRNVEALPVLLFGERQTKEEATAGPNSEKKARNRSSGFRHWMSEVIERGWSCISDWAAWLATGTITFAFWFAVSVAVLAVGSAHLSCAYDQAFQDRVAHMEADSVTNTVTLNRLLALGLAIKLERGSSPDDWYLVLQGVRKAAAPVDSPEGPAVEFWR